MKDEVIGRVGACIYCRTTAERLSREHIIPFGLDGVWVLEEASCTKCAEITGRIEYHVLRKHLLRPRAGLPTRTRRQKNRPKAFPLELVSADKTEIHELATAEIPILLALPLFDWPECVDVQKRSPAIRTDGISLVGGDLIQVAGPPMEEFMNWLRRNNFEAVNFRERYSPELFARFIAKIAYGFAVAQVGLNNIEESYVLPAILGTTRDIGRWVGCDLDATPDAENGAHRVTIRVVDNEILGHVKLFAQIGTQEYLVAIGRKHNSSAI